MDYSSIQALPGALMTVLNFAILGWCFLGVVVGILFGAAPGLTATTAVALFTPVTF